MPEVLLSPVQTGEALELASAGDRKLYWKEIIPFGEIKKNGKRWIIDKAFGQKVIEAFKQKAYPQVAFQMADKDNKHTQDIRDFGGEVQALEMTDTGIRGLLSLTATGAKVVADNPRLPVSGRFVFGRTTNSGKTFDVALHHVLGTLDPHVDDMNHEWQEALQLSSQEVDEVTDATGTQVQPLQNANTQALQQFAQGDAPVQITQQDLELANKMAGQLTLDIPAAQVQTPAQQAPAASQQQDQGDLELTAKVNDLQAQNQTIMRQLCEQRFINEASTLIDAGVPPKLLELSRDVLSAPQVEVLELTADDGSKRTVNPADVIRAILNECKGVLQLNNEQGHSVGLTTDDAADQEADQLLNDWKF